MPFRQYRDLKRDEFIVAGYDMAMGGEDYSACVFISKTYNDVPLLYHSKEIATIATNKLLPALSRIYEETGIRPVIAPERNAGGVYEIERMLNSGFAHQFTMYQTKTAGNLQDPLPSKYGWETNSATRPKMLEELKACLDNRLLTINDEILITELFAFIVNKTTSGWKAQAEQGAHDDLVMALAIAWQLYQTESKPKDMYHVMSQVEAGDFSLN